MTRNIEHIQQPGLDEVLLSERDVELHSFSLFGATTMTAELAVCCNAVCHHTYYNWPLPLGARQTRRLQTASEPDRTGGHASANMRASPIRTVHATLPYQRNQDTATFQGF